MSFKLLATLNVRPIWSFGSHSPNSFDQFGLVCNDWLEPFENNQEKEQVSIQKRK